MKLLERAKPAAYSKERAIVASAERIPNDRRQLQQYVTNRSTAAAAAWQERAWINYDAIGEIKFAYGMIASVMSRIRLYPAVVVDSDAPPIQLTDAVTIERPDDESESSYKGNNGVEPAKALQARDVYRKEMGRTNVPGLMRTFTLNISVPGECHLANIRNEWLLRSTSELTVDTGGKKLRTSRGGTPQELPEDTTIGRIWREHPRYSSEPDSAMLALIDDCEELLLLSRVIRSNSRARLNAGILYIPDEITVVNTTATDDPETEEAEEDQFESELYEAIVGPVNNEENPNSVYPLLLRGPGDLGAQIRHILLERKTDEFLVQRADRTLDRIMQGLDVPKDIVTGLANVKYSNAVQIDESLYKAHVEPLCLTICDAITEIVYRPALIEAGWDPEEAQRMVVWYDPSEVTTRPDRAEDAQALYDNYELSGSALRAARGFSDQDKPSEEEIAARVALSNTPPPELLNMLMQQALPTVLKKLAKSQAGEEALPTELQNTLNGTESPVQPAIDPTLSGEM